MSAQMGPRTSPLVTKRRVLLDLITEWSDHNKPGAVWFAAPDADSADEDNTLPELSITAADFRALGEPLQISVTLEPGDLLNPPTTEGAPA